MWNFVASIQQTLDEAAGLSSEQRTTAAGETTLDTSPPTVTDGNLDNAEQEGSHSGSSGSSENDESSLPEVEPDEVAHKQSAGGEDEPAVHGMPVKRQSPHETPPPQQQQVLADSVDVVNDDDDNKRGTSLSFQDGPAAVQTPSPPQPSNMGHSGATSSSSHPLPSSDAAASAREQQLASLAHSLQQRVEQWKPIIATVDALKLEGQSLSQQLGAEREKWKIAVQERKAAVAKFEACQEQLNLCKTKEVRWAETQAMLQDSNQALKDRVAVLESNIMKQSDDIRHLSEARAEAEERFRAVSARLAESSEESVAQQERETFLHQSELERLQEALLLERQAHRQAVLDHEHQHATLQRDVAIIEERAHAAESRMLDNDGRASAGMQELVLQCQRAEEQIAALQRQLCGKQEEVIRLTSAQQAAETAVADSTLRLEQRVRTLTAERKAQEIELSKTAAALMKAQLRCDELLRSQDDLLARNWALDHELSILRSRKPLQEVEEESPTKPRNGRTHGRPLHHDDDDTTTTAVDSTAAAVTDYNEAANIVSLLQPAAVVPSSSSSSPSLGISLHHQQRLEREISRLTKEVRRLKSVEQASTRIKAQLDALVPQHDMLLQMYGQMEEQLEDARSDAKQVKSVYQHQLDFMGDELEKLNRRVNGDPVVVSSQ